MSEDRPIRAQWTYVLGEGRVIVYGLTEKPLILTPKEAEDLGGLQHHADMAKAAPVIMEWLTQGLEDEETAAKLLVELAQKAQSKDSMKALLKAFGL